MAAHLRCTQFPQPSRSTHHHPISYCLCLCRCLHLYLYHLRRAALLGHRCLSTSASARRRHTLQRAASHHAPLRVKNHIGNPPPPVCSLDSPESALLQPSPTQTHSQRLRHTLVKICHQKLPSCNATPQQPQLPPSLLLLLVLPLSQNRPVTSSPVRQHSTRRDSAHCPAFQPFRGPRKTYTKSQGTMVLCLTLQV